MILLLIITKVKTYTDKDSDELIHIHTTYSIYLHETACIQLGKKKWEGKERSISL
jgi:hypothetical protein